MKPAEFIAKWEARANELERMGALVDGATLCRDLLKDLEALRGANEDDLLSLADAAATSGYTRDHLSRLIRDGKIPNAGRRGAPRIRRGDLPRRPRAVAPSQNGAYDPVTDARKLVSRRRGGANGLS